MSQIWARKGGRRGRAFAAVMTRNQLPMYIGDERTKIGHLGAVGTSFASLKKVDRSEVLRAPDIKICPPPKYPTSRFFPIFFRPFSTHGLYYQHSVTNSHAGTIVVCCEFYSPHRWTDQRVHFLRYQMHFLASRCTTSSYIYDVVGRNS